MQSTLIAQLRDWIIVVLKPKLHQAALENRGIESSHHALFLDLITTTKTNLESLEHKERIQDLISACEECRLLLQQSGFEKNYQKQKEQLLDKPMDEAE